jgi:hypothetical protein
VTSIFLAGFDAPQSMSISELGVGADGATTFALSPGTPTDSEEDAPIPFTCALAPLARVMRDADQAICRQ